MLGFGPPRSAPFSCTSFKVSFRPSVPRKHSSLPAMQIFATSQECRSSSPSQQPAISRKFIRCTTSLIIPRGSLLSPWSIAQAVSSPYRDLSWRARRLASECLLHRQLRNHNPHPFPCTLGSSSQNAPFCSLRSEVFDGGNPTPGPPEPSRCDTALGQRRQRTYGHAVLG